MAFNTVVWNAVFLAHFGHHPHASVSLWLNQFNAAKVSQFAFGCKN